MRIFGVRREEKLNYACRRWWLEHEKVCPRLHYAAFCIVPYFPRSRRSVNNIPVDSLLSATNLDDVAHCSEEDPLADDPSDPSGYQT